MSRTWNPRTGLIGVVLALGCNERPCSTSADEGSLACDGAALEYHNVCFFPHSVGATGAEHPVDFDGQPGHELIGVEDQRVLIHKFDGDGFVLVGEAALPGETSSQAGVIVGELDDVPGLDLTVTEPGKWAAVYHREETGALSLVDQTNFQASESLNRAFKQPVAVGPDAMGRWRVVAHYENGVEYVSSNPLALWEVQGATWVQAERFELPTGACELMACAGGDLNGDLRRDAVCTIEDVCGNDSPEDDIVHVVLLAQADGAMSVAAYPTKDIDTSFFLADLNDDGMTDLLGWTAGWYRLANSGGGLGPVVQVDKPAAPMQQWYVLAMGDIDGDQDDEIVLGDHEHGLVLTDVVETPQTWETLVVTGVEFSIGRASIDVNGDEIVDLPMREGVLLVSEARS
jgi:hypothetical protein